MFSCCTLFSLLCAVQFSSTITASPVYNILAILPFPGRSHYVAFKPILEKLAAKGHNVTVYSSFPNATPVPNFKHVDLRRCLKQNINSDDSIWRLDRSAQRSTLSFMKDIADTIATVEEVIGCPAFTDLVVDNKEKYDLLITEFFSSDWVLGYAEKFGIPFVGLVSMSVQPWVSDTVALPEYPSYLRYGQVTTVDDEMKQAMSFFERLQNLYNFYVIKLSQAYYMRPRTDVIMKALFGAAIPSANAIALNTSLILACSHFSVNSVRPFVPAVVEIGGINIGEKTPLPKVSAFLDIFTTRCQI